LEFHEQPVRLAVRFENRFPGVAAALLQHLPQAALRDRDFPGEVEHAVQLADIDPQRLGPIKPLARVALAAAEWSLSSVRLRRRWSRSSSAWANSDTREKAKHDAFPLMVCAPRNSF